MMLHRHTRFPQVTRVGLAFVAQRIVFRRK